VVSTVINNAFEGDILTYLAHGEIRAGDDWKKMIKDNLKNCDAIISIITPQSIKRPWLFIEWSAFWLADKKWYLLLTDEIKVPDLIQPMQDRQTTNMLDETSVKVLFRGLAQDSGRSAVPVKFVDLFIDAIKDAISQQSQETADHSYGKYRENLLNLPENDHEKFKIAEYFYQRGEFNIYQNIVRALNGTINPFEDGLYIKTTSLPRQGREDIAENSQKHTYFLSYSKKNSSEADHLEVVLHRNNRTVLRDETEIKAGEGVSKSIEAMIQQADTFVALWGKDYATSDWCPNELEYARNQQVNGQKPTRIVLLTLDETKVPIRFVDSLHLAGQDRRQRELAIHKLLKEEQTVPHE
jgi:hypothetical protein